METEGGGWTVFQRRNDGSVDFYRDLADYEEGFGDLEGEFWLGLRQILRLTQAGLTSLHIEVGYGTTRGYAKYSTFNIGDSSEQYKLTISGYSGNAGNSMLSGYNLNNQPFTTKDNDRGGCANYHQGAWWYYSSGCTRANLNGQFSGGAHYQNMFWYHNYGWNALNLSEMKIRHE